MIPKKIHYCWFGENPLPESAKKYIESWKKFLPDFEIIEWNENNFDISENIYVKEAYENKKYAFVSDYARLKILYDNGGIYFDTDVELIKRIPDELLETGFLGKEDNKYINTGLGFACKKGDKTIKKMLDDYKGIHFVNPDGGFDETSCPVRNTESLKDGVASDIVILPKEFLSPKDYLTGIEKITKNTISIHHSDASWWSEKDRKLLKRRHEKNKKYGRVLGDISYYSSRVIDAFRKNKDE